MQSPWLSALAFGVVAGLYGTTPVSAQPVISGTFYEESKMGSCSNGTCTTEFAPPTSRVLLTKINCAFSSLPGATTLYGIGFGIRDTSGAAIRRIEYLPFNPVPATINTGVKAYTMSATLDFLTAPERYPTVQGFTDGSTVGASINCKITGRIQP